MLQYNTIKIITFRTIYSPENRLLATYVKNLNTINKVTEASVCLGALTTIYNINQSVEVY
jgi:hypothetical protein